MIEIKNTIERNVEETGFSHVADLSLVPKTQPLDLTQWLYIQHGEGGIARQLHDRVTSLEANWQLLNPTS